MPGTRILMCCDERNMDAGPVVAISKILQFNSMVLEQGGEREGQVS